MKRVLGNSIFLALFVLSVVLIVMTPSLMMGFIAVALGDEELGNTPGYMLFVFFRPHLFVALLWSVFVLAVRRNWLLFG